ncbi:hypothetical protein [Polaribacter sp. Hel_I_88]|uniref:hypothetical protein n=1 Tax=Polaribacter sp. Hel_I_88 TaxID=1250006 RepID=UPI00047A9AFB|nr:hypothetical protein [Polaribacter sp. Hel_I_88]
MKILNTIFTLLAIILGVIGFFFLEGIEARIIKVVSLFFVLFRLYSYLLYEFYAEDSIYNLDLNRRIEGSKVKSK